MKMNFLTISLFSFFSITANAWTLSTAARSGFPTSDIVIKISSNTCANAGFTASSLETLVNDAINDYWSKVPTSSLNLTTGGVISVNISGDDLTNAAAKTDVNTIVVGCSQNATSFPDGSILGVGGLGCSASNVCRAAVLLNDTAATQLDTLDRSIIVATFAHELGHALGLGHSSVTHALMYYTGSNKTQKSLSQDDIDGISYLYPEEKKLGGLAGACGTIDTTPKGPGNFLGAFLFGLGLIYLGKLVLRRRQKYRHSAIEI
jgi:hypothetical protein